jgi:hypothetical protein
MGAAKRIESAIRNEIPELYVLGNPPASVVAFGSKVASVNVHEVGDAMSSRGWHLNALINPGGLHIACTVRQILRSLSLFIIFTSLFYFIPIWALPVLPEIILAVHTVQRPDERVC